MLAAIRPDSVNLPLMLHVLGAMLLVGTLLAVTLVTVLGWRSPENATGLSRFALKTLLLGVLPAYLLMRIGAQWIYSRSIYDDLPEDPTWIGIGFIVADLGALLTLVALILGGIGVSRLNKGGGQGLLKAAMVIAWLVLAAALVAVWAMAGKPD